MFDLITAAEISALATVLLIDIVLAGDNAVVVGMAAAGLPPATRKRVIFIGIVAATLLRIAFAAFAVQLLQVIGLTLAGGILLLWVAWKFWRELRTGHTEGKPVSGQVSGLKEKTFRQAVVQIIVADISMSLDNVLAVAGAARDHPWVMVVGLSISVMLMGAVAALIAALLQKHRWIAYLGLALIAYVAVKMIWDGGFEVLLHATS